MVPFPEFQAEGELLHISAISKVYGCHAGIELAETPLSLDKRIQAVRIHYGTKNAVGTVRQFQFECEETSDLQVASEFRRHF